MLFSILVKNAPAGRESKPSTNHISDWNSIDHTNFPKLNRNLGVVPLEVQ